MDTVTLSRLLELSRVVEPYAENWQEWTRSSHCFLGKKHIRAAELFLLLHSYNRVARKMNTNSVEVIYTLIACISRLKLFQRIYEDWVEECKSKTIALPKLPPFSMRSYDSVNHLLIDSPYTTESLKTVIISPIQPPLINNL